MIADPEHVTGKDPAPEPEVPCAVTGCGLSENEHWFEYDYWHPHRYQRPGIVQRLGIVTIPKTPA